MGNRVGEHQHVALVDVHLLHAHGDTGGLVAAGEHCAPKFGSHLQAAGAARDLLDLIQLDTRVDSPFPQQS